MPPRNERDGGAPKKPGCRVPDPDDDVAGICRLEALVCENCARGVLLVTPPLPADAEPLEAVVPPLEEALELPRFRLRPLDEPPRFFLYSHFRFVPYKIYL